jgi:HK97 family phage major capsid protein
MAEISTNEKTQIQSLTKKLMSKLIAQEGEGDVEKLALRLKSLQQDKNGAINLTLKAPIHTGVNTIAPTNDNLEIYRSPREVNRLLNFVTILPGSTNGAVETYTEMFNETGNATVVECGDLKPLIGASFRKNTVNPFKVACHIKECDDVFIYIERLESTLTALLEDELKDAKDAAVLAKIQASANLYNLTTINTTNPNQKDAIIAAIAQVRALNYYPTHIALNPIDKANFEISKASDGHYLFMCGCNADGSMMISTLKVIETNQIPVGSFLVADLTKVNVRMITDVILRMGYGVTVTGVGPVTNVTDDLIHDVVTIVAEQFMSMYIRQLDGNAFVYDTFANVQTAL